MPIFDIYDEKTPRRIQVIGEDVSIGRTSDNHIVISDPRASRQHCRIGRAESGFVLFDLQSRNGTELNRHRIEEPTPMRNGDEICIGKAVIRFWVSPKQIDPDAPKLPVMKSALPAKVRPQGRPRPRRDREKAATAVSESITFSDQLIGFNDAGRLKIAETIVYNTAGPLTLNDIIPLNYAGKPAHARDKDASEVSEAMLRLKQVILKSFQLKATDIHIEPREERLDLRYRIDGYLHTAGSLEIEVARSMYSIVKLLCNVDINKKHIMVDGSFAVQLPNRRVDLRVSVAPSTLGDKMVLRILDKELAPQSLETLGMDGYILQEVRRETSRESSMIVVCGPTGSGKTTTVYAVLHEMNSHSKNIVTVEDPVEYKINSVTQIQVDAKHNITFAAALSTLLRQDPDIILIGEMRDPETARMAVQSAMTGHLVLSTVHARDSIGCVFRMLDLGVEPFLLGSALSSVLSQRLLRTLCPRCKMKFKPSVRDLNELGLDNIAGTDLYAPVGCEDCLGIGHKGRAAIFEMLSINDQVRDAICSKPSIQQLRVAAGDWIFQTLREDGVRKLRDGLVSLDEFRQVSRKD